MPACLKAIKKKRTKVGVGLASLQKSWYCLQTPADDS